MSKWTPGPWKWDSQYWTLTGADGKPVIDSAMFEGMWFCGPDAAEKANMNLCAAAPELVEVIRRYLASAATPHKVDLAEVDQAARALLARLEAE